MNRSLLLSDSPHARHWLYEYLVVPLLLVLVAFLVAHGIFFGRFDARQAARIQALLTENETKLDAVLDEVAGCVDSLYVYSDPFQFLGTWQETLLRDEMSVLVLRDGSPVFWSDSEVTYNDDEFPADSLTAFMRLADGWYVVHRREHAGCVLVGCLRVRHVYMLQNKFLSNDFRADFDLPATVKVSTRPVDDGTAFYDSRGHYLFSLVFSGIYPYRIHVPALLYFISFLMLLQLCCNKIPRLIPQQKRTLYMLVSSVTLCALNYLAQTLHVPHVCYELSLFSPELFASSRLFPSLGNLAVWCMLLMAMARMVHVYFQPDDVCRSRWLKLLVPLAGMALTMVNFHGIRALVRIMVLNSSIFTLDQSPLDIHPASVLVYVILLMQSVTFMLLLDKTLSVCPAEWSFRRYLKHMAPVLLVVETFKCGLFQPPSCLEALLLLAAMLYLGHLRTVRRRAFRLLDFSVMTVALAIFITVNMVHYANIRHAEEMEQRAAMLSMRQDPVAESLLVSMYDKLEADEDLLQAVSQVISGTSGETQLSDFLKSRYGAGYLQRYLLETALCTDGPDAPLSDSRVELFHEMVERQGVPISQYIWYIEDPAAPGAAYLVWLPVSVEGVPADLFLMLSSQPNFSASGYPQLLLDDRTYVQMAPQGYSYAIYHRQELVQSQGSFDYNLNSRMFDQAMPGSGMIQDHRYRHFVYHDKQPFTIVVTKPVYSFMHGIVMFSCIELTYLLLLMAGLTVLRLVGGWTYRIQWNFRRKFQFSMIAMLCVFNLSVCVCTAVYLMHQQRVKGVERLHARLQDVSRELEEVTRGRQQLLQRDLQGFNRQLDEKLAHFATLFNTDIHVYDTDGLLIGTSREELFTDGLSSDRLHPEAYKALIADNQRSVILRERIGGLRFSAGYLMWRDDSGRPVAVVALPYFEEREKMVNTLTEVMAAALNISVLALVIAVLLAMVVTRTITQPLHMIQEKISRTALHHANHKIVYRHDDEIGGLVKAYNQMVDELAVSVQKLARSEREAVWRDMAKQVSHEINNPLTPMKLSIQHLQRAWASRSEKFGGYMETIPPMLIEQIDLLSSISREFSAFAKMPSAYNQPMDIVAKIENAITLYDSDQMEIQFSHPHDSRVLIYADKEQMLRVFINLFKNAEQAVPAGREPLVRVALVVRDAWVYVRVRDNGAGIPPEMQERIFRPEFTTKSKGMGLGLAIVKNTVEAAGGAIGFRTWPQRGTSFTMRLPVWTGTPAAAPEEEIHS